MLTLKICDKNNNILAEENGENIDFLYEKKYNEGDRIEISGSEFMTVQLSEKLKESIIYVPGKTLSYEIPFGEKLAAYADGAWDGDKNRIRVGKTPEEEIYSKRNIALNSAAKRFEKTYFPYAEANYVTRDEAGFEERNAIDGVIETAGHGVYPFQSYAGGAREDLEYYLYFGRKVEIEKIVFYLRADFKDDHDTYWKSLNVEFDDGEKIGAHFIKSGEAQVLELKRPKITEKIHLTDFKQISYPLSWAALSQIEVYGKIIKQ